MIFDDVLIPWERIFLMRKPKEANALFRSRVMSVGPVMPACCS